MNRVILVCVLGFSLFWQNANGQSRRIDSLKARLNELPLDTERVNTLLDLGSRIFQSDYQAALGFVGEAKELSEKLNFSRVTPNINNTYAEFYQYFGAADIAMDYGLKALSGYQEAKDTLGMARACVILGLIHANIEEFEKAKKRYSEAESYYAAKKNIRGVIVAKHNVAALYGEMGDTVGADSIYRINLKQLIGSKYIDILAATYNNLANNMDLETNADSALSYFDESLNLKRKVGKAGPIANTFINISKVLRLNERYKEAEKTLDSAEHYLQNVSSLELWRDFHQANAKLFQSMARFKEAAVHFEEVIRLQDSLFSQSSVEMAQHLNAAFDTKEKESQITLLNQQKVLAKADGDRLWWFNIALGSALALTVVLLSLAFFRGRERRRTFLLLRRKNDEIQRQQSEILLQNEQFAKQNRRLEEVNREKDGLIGIVAHDLRAPLNRSAALAELIRSSGPLTDDQIKFLNMLHKVNEDGGRLIQDLLEMNSYENNEFRMEHTMVNLNDLIERSARGFTKLSREKSIELHTQPSGSTVEVNTDEKLLGRILDNLLSNAIKFTRANKHVVVGAGMEAGHAYVYVKDEGQGISPEDQKKMFQKFQRLTARPTGGESSTGLGLSIVKTLVDRLNGQILVESEVGKGTEFRIKLPSA